MQLQDSIVNIISTYDNAGKYLDSNAITNIKKYFDTADTRLGIVKIINANSSLIIQQASSQLFERNPELIRPSGNAYTTRRYAACLRDIDYYLRYASYSIVANDTSVLSSRVLAGLKDTYNSLGVPLASIVTLLELLKELIKEKTKNINDAHKYIDEPFLYMMKILCENDV
uniref:Allophycocyanin subunit beta-18 n=1 Tax=Cyanidium caldarium TaxID=2771 RepID=APCF_CYACA|nr:allophycocyanin beta 18 subunit [Cyanidium caldarium]O19896.1 RecName: Full=Allophycocyanin subunit beta-18; Short=Allophycocyanin subunit B18 [Cyanidium caldarium]AAB82693.1 unknown [Cyanidium caldarium]WDB00195.1 allophycocyanin beta 18 subunit [Cyanidium caldarium]